MEQEIQPNVLIKAQVMHFRKPKGQNSPIWQKSGFKVFLLTINPDYIGSQAILAVKAIEDVLEDAGNPNTKFVYHEHEFLTHESHFLNPDLFEKHFQERFKAYREKKTQSQIS